MPGGRWSGDLVRAARAKWRPRLPQPCCRCGKPVLADPETGWQVDHWPVPREAGGKDTWPAHARCNEAAGGRRGAQITNSRRVKTEKRQARSRGRNIRGI